MIVASKLNSAKEKGRQVKVRNFIRHSLLVAKILEGPQCLNGDGPTLRPSASTLSMNDQPQGGLGIALQGISAL